MRNLLVIIEIIAIIACVIFGTVWYLNPTENWEPLFGLTGLMFIIVEVIRRCNKASQIEATKLAAFIEEGQSLLQRLNEDPLPVSDHNKWVDRMNGYFQENKARSYEVRLSDFSGLVFYGDSSKKSQMKRSIDGRIRRLHEFISELNRE